ncbi:DUF2612 domain-containing protein [Pectobacterium carotovorum]|uniref:DUF2612 domain-containing protein n=1 Tax=Pectobacterium carotovorum subsp. carotovorum TaxID=555 RepID=A0AAI9KZZ2_PECCC|nr:DUF2612 domain-containing protein [Pectobacterium carotovorum]GKX47959.1 hypothetical protein SOASR016_27110 [Pectobacterium carotovorum subsp. carotovorum]GLV70403.1 hypothetical protein Pcaca03_28470 [Pectobacterium carotovorum subsp. carotovorum]
MSKYTEIIPNYNATKPLFVQHVDLSTRPLIDVSSQMQALVNAFDIDNAIGDQLDTLGQWIGRSRTVMQPIVGVYFSFDTDNVGYDQGVWQRQFDPDSGFVDLSDEAYRIVLRTKIAINQWDGQNDSLPAILSFATAGSGLSMQIIDNQDMTISVWVFPETSIDSVSREILAVIRQGYLTVKAAGVFSGEILYPSVGNQFFGFDIENEYIAGFDQGAWETSLNG